MNVQETCKVIAVYYMFSLHLGSKEENKFSSSSLYWNKILVRFVFTIKFFRMLFLWIGTGFAEEKIPEWIMSYSHITAQKEDDGRGYGFMVVLLLLSVLLTIFCRTFGLARVQDGFSCIVFSIRYWKIVAFDRELEQYFQCSSNCFTVFRTQVSYSSDSPK